MQCTVIRVVRVTFQAPKVKTPVVRMETMAADRMNSFHWSKLAACCSSSTMEALRAKPTNRQIPMTKKRPAPITFITKFMVKWRIL